MKNRVKIGLIGVGHLGKIHLNCLKESNKFEIIGIHDSHPETGKTVAEQAGIPFFESIDQLLPLVDAIDIVTPTLFHHDIAKKAMHLGKHCFIEKPITTTIHEAKELIDLKNEHQLIAQVGHVERFNPAYLAVKDLHIEPKFIEAHRLAPFKPRGTDVSIVLDLMIHDLDIVLSKVSAPIRSISASGVSLVSPTPDIANARIEFENGCVANLTASRISMKSMRKLRLFQKDAYVSIDFLEKQTEMFQLGDPESLPDGLDMELGEGKEKKRIRYTKPTVEPVNAIKEELESFAESILNQSPVAVTLEDGYRALEVAGLILEKINQNALL